MSDHPTHQQVSDRPTVQTGSAGHGMDQSGSVPAAESVYSNGAGTPTQRRQPVTAPKVRARKGGEPVVMLTAYTAPMARLLDPHVDVLLVGDSLGMVLYGLPSTLPVSLDMMIAHGAAVVRGASSAMVVVDMPFATYEGSAEQAYANAARVLAETGAAAVKVEGGAYLAPTIRFLVDRGIPVMGHIGLQPQSQNAYGGFRARGRTAEDRARILDDAKAVDQAGAFAMVVEATVEDLAQEITAAVACPTIGIGASASCDGQVLVSEDMLGLHDGRLPKFVQQFATLHPHISDAAASYAAAVRARRFPEDAHVYRPTAAKD